MKNEKNNSSLVFLTFSHSFMFPQSSSTRAVKLINSCWKEKLKKLIKKITIVVKKSAKTKKETISKKIMDTFKTRKLYYFNETVILNTFFSYLFREFSDTKNELLLNIFHIFLKTFFSFQEQCFFQHVGLLFGQR